MVNGQMVKGSVSLMLLGLLVDSDMYGYQMIRELGQKSGQVFAFKEGTLYPHLHELEREGFIESYWEKTPLKRKRKYYHITEKGRRCFERKQAEWVVFTGAVNRVLEGGYA